jgi:hypothetical protein
MHGRTRMFELPADDTAPLIEFQREIAMALDPLGVICGAESVKFIPKKRRKARH